MKKNVSIMILILGIFSFFFPFVGPHIMYWTQDNTISRGLGAMIFWFPFIFPSFLGLITSIWGIIYCISIKPKPSINFWRALIGMLFGFFSIGSSLLFFIITIVLSLGCN